MKQLTITNNIISTWRSNGWSNEKIINFCNSNGWNLNPNLLTTEKQVIREQRLSKPRFNDKLFSYDIGQIKSRPISFRTTEENFKLLIQYPNKSKFINQILTEHRKSK